MSDELVKDFAVQEPDRFAALISAGPFDELVAILKRLPAPIAVAVAARLPAEAFERVIKERFDELREWMGSATFDDSVQLIGRLSPGEAVVLVDGVRDDRLRRRLRQFMNFPEHCVGAAVVSVELQVREQMPVAEVLAELRRVGGAAEVPAVVLDEAGRLLGKLDLWKLLLTEAPIGTAGDFVAPAPTLYPETSIASAMELPYWADHQWLAVVDRGRRLLGVVSRRRVLAGGDEQPEASPLLDDIAEVCQQFYRVAGDLLGRLLGGRTWS